MFNQLPTVEKGITGAHTLPLMWYAWTTSFVTEARNAEGLSTENLRCGRIRLVYCHISRIGCRHGPLKPDDCIWREIHLTNQINSSRRINVLLLIHRINKVHQFRPQSSRMPTLEMEFEPCCVDEWSCIVDGPDVLVNVMRCSLPNKCFSLSLLTTSASDLRLCLTDSVRASLSCCARCNQARCYSKGKLLIYAPC